MVNDVSFDGLPMVCTAVHVNVRGIYLTALNDFFTFISKVSYIVGGTWLIRLSTMPHWFG